MRLGPCLPAAGRRRGRGAASATTRTRASGWIRSQHAAKGPARGGYGVACVARERYVRLERETADLSRVDHGHHAVLAVLPRVLGAVYGNGVGVVDRDTEDVGLVKGLAF